MHLNSTIAFSAVQAGFQRIQLTNAQFQQRFEEVLYLTFHCSDTVATVLHLEQLLPVRQEESMESGKRDFLGVVDLEEPLVILASQAATVLLSLLRLSSDSYVCLYTAAIGLTFELVPLFWLGGIGPRAPGDVPSRFQVLWKSFLLL